MQEKLQLPAHLGMVRGRNGLLTYFREDMYIGKSIETYGEFSFGEQKLFQLLVQPNDLIIDVGANIGAHTLYFADLVGPGGTVFSFEPQHPIFQLLCANLVLNGVGNTKAFNVAVGDCNCEVYIPRVNYTKHGNFGAIRTYDVPIKGAVNDKVTKISIDSLDLDRRLKLLKIDTEGHELEVLYGADVTIKLFKPIIYLENDESPKAKQVIRWLFKRDYRIWWHIVPLFSEDNLFGVKEDIFPNIVSINMLCIHKDVSVEIDLPEITKYTDTFEKLKRLHPV